VTFDLKKNKEFLIHLSVWLTIVIIISLIIYKEIDILSFNQLSKIGFYIVFFYINYLVLVPKLLLKKKMFKYFISALLLMIVYIFLFPEIFPANRINKPPFGKKLPFFLFYIRNALALIILLFSGTLIRIFTVWSENEKKKNEIESQKAVTELQLLKNQLNPHFLFNSLNSIYSLTTKKSNDAPEAVITLSELLRYMLYQTNSDFVLLEKELVYIQNYLKLQRLRIANNENVTLNIHGNITNQKIRPLLLISFIENAFKYGTDFKGNTMVDIDIYVDKNKFKFNCINLIGNSKKDDNSSGIGLKNSKERLELLYPEKHELIVENDGNYFKLLLTLNLD